MRTKITTDEQLRRLRPGDTIIRYPVNGDTAPAFDEGPETLTDIYQVSVIDPGNDMVHLIAPAPGTLANLTNRVRKLFIYRPLLLSQGVWWL